MRWNWQQPDWPNFTFDKSRLDILEERFLYASGVLFGAFVHLPDDEKSQLTVELILASYVDERMIEHARLGALSRPQ